VLLSRATTVTAGTERKRCVPRPACPAVAHR
jgi:hypothetical protein